MIRINKNNEIPYKQILLADAALQHQCISRAMPVYAVIT